MNILVSWGWGVLAPPLLSSLPWWWVGWRGEVEGGGCSSTGPFPPNAFSLLIDYSAHV